jgi:hypothetical protein
VIREYDTSFAIAPYKTDHRAPSDVNQRFALILVADCIPSDKSAFMNCFVGVKGIAVGKNMKVRAILGNFKPYRDIVQGILESLWELGHIIGVSFDQYDDVTTMALP